MPTNKITLIACKGKAWYSELIKDVEQGEITHIAGFALGGILESEGIKLYKDKYPGVWVHPEDEYVNGKDCEFITIPVYSISRMNNYIFSNGIIGTPYGYPDCVTAGAYRLLGIELPTDGELTMMCSELWTRLLRIAGPVGFELPDLKADFIDPQRLYDSIKKGAI